jgi:hypothetical protein
MYFTELHINIRFSNVLISDANIIIIMLCFCHVIFTGHLFIAVLSSFCTYAVLAGPLGDRFCNPHVVIFGTPPGVP